MLLLAGPSPRVRGSRDPAGDSAARGGSIPACAGKPEDVVVDTGNIRVHPRVCGEARGRTFSEPSPSGPSPRVRGSHGQDGESVSHVGSIPACAGKPIAPRAAGRGIGVHPRVCGEAHAELLPLGEERGPSPRVRGSRGRLCRGAEVDGSIPACAGKPARRSPGSSSGAVHPRVCGEAGVFGQRQLNEAGPSPRVRGSPPTPVVAAHLWGSIPACAGKPMRSVLPSRVAWVHPRVCGEAASSAWSASTLRGPSPRVRGSPTDPEPTPTPAGSIPACAGKPGR